MESCSIFDSGATEHISHSELIEEAIEDVLVLIECMKQNGTKIVCSDNLYDVQCFGVGFYDWIYDYVTDPQLRDIKKELSIKLNRADTLSSTQYEEYCGAIKNQDGENGLVMQIYGDQDNLLCIFSEAQYWKAKQWFLSKYVQRADFVDEMRECFPNIYFHDHVGSSFNTLNGDFQQERALIVAHLHALDTFWNEAQELLEEHTSFRTIAEKFQQKFEFECSTQAGREGVKKLKFSFQNLNTGADEIICCELHTKLKWRNMDRNNQDRIYFHPGKPGIAGGKILVAHIGDHV